MGSFNAVILAAGRGSRLGALGKATPKGLIRIAGGTLIERSIGYLLDLGVGRITVVTGHCSDRYDKLFRHNELVELVPNPDYATTGSFASLLVGLAHTNSSVPLLILDSDIIFQKISLQAILSAEGDSILTSGKTESGDEVWVVSDAYVLKEISKYPKKEGKEVSEFVGITRINPGLCRELLSFSDSFAQPNQMEYEEVLDYLCKTHNIMVRNKQNLLWAEIDTVEQLERAKALFEDSSVG